MAAPIAHIFLALQMLAGPLKDRFNEQEFIIGTSFADIRYLGVIKRDQTHIKNLCMEDIIKETDSFRAGLMFHSFVDEQRERYMQKHEMYTKIPNFRFASQALKFAEDLILISHCDHTDYAQYFDVILEQELAFGIPKKHIQDWHQLLQTYVRNGSKKQFMYDCFEAMLNKPSFFKRWIFSLFYMPTIERTVTIVINNKEIHRLVCDFYLNFSEHCSSSFR